MPIKNMYYSMIPVVLLFGALSAWADHGCGVSDVLSKKQARALEVRPSTREEQIASYYRERASLERHCKDSASHLTEQAILEQSSLFGEWTGRSKHFYDLTRISSYVLNAKGQPPVELANLQESAAALFDAQQRFFETLTRTQRAALSSQLHALEKLRHDTEKRLNRLATGTTSSANRSYFKTVSGLRRDLEGWNAEQQEIANRLGIHSHESAERR